ncbi:hypothetical protein A3E97_00230 [Candidatus Uhrbacteria bacterium RIFCSPHIGHO2_12_FULL_47_12]|uniref:DUF3048 domain-containing protein n=1 Tax=Candidatus Uhrbacteria bacterium RIFCSPLOWO2_02_FULL_48_18 TaxID=1802408 RepID=A0A1F7V8X5_9BACT|nr:MAG: hypothetical protein A3E97_00230 [Candidatus Uhrbacteria bacterium RIFCSPHIGHO2_12_FULL_47_12]OGL81760.1 MAG: hypothetical protein A3B20_01545 [Candidatus Uhrbacteria bacterium RIFCSPLOWO2_01_FULL_47_17]OGL86923.1 MAG: hypothetical protein A3I41_03135 [Candidatus Uhrbacteria bacterium RIFCSPLOWO2_02_FULL_48_18]OGL94322.1 MAG: hypothetical protein A3H12_04985 [Candidatus Uhrbacteria bacterium RIFCSPLOWO2_12_FULL_47_9]
MERGMFSKIKHKRLFATVAITLVFLIVGTAWFGLHAQTNKTDLTNKTNTVSASQTQSRDPLTGLLVEEVHANQQVYGVMIDEHMDARAQSGIDQAFLVIEAPVEAGIPRLLAFFSEDQKVEKIGPVRSARPYFVDWALEFDALYTHVGGSNEALAKIANGATFDLNEFWHDPQFWRATNRSAPHNTYTSTDRMGEYVKAKRDAGRAAPLYGVWKFKTTKPTEVLPEKFSIRYASSDYTFSWAYDVEQKAYVRLFDDQPVKTLEGNKIDAQNVIVMISDVEVIDSIGRRHIRTTGEGVASVFQDGKKMEAVWKKPAASERLRFYTKEGQEIEMNPGKTWIEVIAEESQLIMQ